MNITLKPFKDVFLFSLIYPQNKDMMLAEWMLLNVRASAVTIPAMGGWGALLCPGLGIQLHRVDVNEGQMK